MVSPTLFHITHWKAGSQWVRAILEDAAPDRIVRSREKPNWFGEPVVSGGIYTPIYATVEQFRAAVPDEPGRRVFVVIRDPRDTLVSWYFSLLHSHTIADATVKESREMLRRISKTDGLALMICNHLYDAIRIQRSWLAAGARVFRYEDLLADQERGFAELFDFCGLELSPRRRRALVARNSFARKTWWRFGRENVKSHLRKGKAGDWRNHFCDRLTRLFKLHYGDDLIRARYENDRNWSADLPIEAATSPRSN